MLLTPSDFAQAWGDDALVRLPAASVPASLPGDARYFLAAAGLPALVRYYEEASEGRLTFCRLAAGLSPVLSEKTVGPPLPCEWSVYWVLGDEFFCNGSAWWCIHERTGQVDRIDIELSQPIQFANSSVAHFASALHTALEWSNRLGQPAENWPSEVDQLKRELAMIDPDSMSSRQHYWPAYLEFICEEGPFLGTFKKDCRSEGEHALQAGAW